MALQKMEMVDKIEVINSTEGYSNIQVRTRTVVVDSETGEQFGNTYHRHVIAPDTDVSGESELVQGIAEKVHTAQAKAAYQAKQQANENAPI